jgi:hypothetical protein
MDRLDELAQVYGRFAQQEARGRSARYDELAGSVAGDRAVLEVLAELPEAKQQPNLLLAAVRFLYGDATGWGQFREWFFEHQDQILDVVLTRSTQTNEPARCATLLPLLATLPQPLALLEVGASAGLCLLPDRYGYRYGDHRVGPAQVVNGSPTFSCAAGPRTPLPAQGVEVAWRAGLDLNPLDVRDDDDVAWLEALVWPGEGQGLSRLRAAIAVARADPPAVSRGDLRHDLPTLAARAPREATLVVFHSAVLTYVSDADERAAFAETVRGLDAVWVANESPLLFGAQARLREPWPTGRFLLTCDERPIAWNDPHGTSTDWFGGTGG